MGTDSSDFLDSILLNIDDLFADVIGPVAVILCEESREFWEDKLKRQNMRPGLRNIYLYINHLGASIEDEQDREEFITNVYNIESIKILKER